MKRKIYNKLVEWKNNHNGKTAILIDGARRIGKSWIVEEFAKNEYKSYILIDFNNVAKNIIELFEEYLTDLDVFFSRLSIYTGIKLYNRESAIIFDEVQMYPRARAAIKYLVKDGRYDFIETGSLVSINHNVKDIVIPSEEIRINMFPMDLEEFAWANNQQISLAFGEEELEQDKIYEKILRGKLDFNKGMLTENIVAQMFKAAGHSLYFYSCNSRENADDRMEIDFLIRKTPTTSKHNICPIEVKSATGYALTSLLKCKKKYAQHIGTPHVLHTGDFKTEDGITYLPLYMAGLL